MLSQRDSYWHTLCSGSFQPGLQDPAPAFVGVSQSADAFKEITPGGGAYQNEGDAFEPNPEESFWGSTYESNLSIKRNIDPGNILTCHQCVGWHPSDERWSCFPKVNRGNVKI